MALDLKALLGPFGGSPANMVQQAQEAPRKQRLQDIATAIAAGQLGPAEAFDRNFPPAGSRGLSRFRGGVEPGVQRRTQMGNLGSPRANMMGGEEFNAILKAMEGESPEPPPPIAVGNARQRLDVSLPYGEDPQVDDAVREQIHLRQAPGGYFQGVSSPANLPQGDDRSGVRYKAELAARRAGLAQKGLAGGDQRDVRLGKLSPQEAMLNMLSRFQGDGSAGENANPLMDDAMLSLFYGERGADVAMARENAKATSPAVQYGEGVAAGMPGTEPEQVKRDLEAGQLTPVVRQTLLDMYNSSAWKRFFRNDSMETFRAYAKAALGDSPVIDQWVTAFAPSASWWHQPNSQSATAQPTAASPTAQPLSTPYRAFNGDFGG